MAPRVLPSAQVGLLSGLGPQRLLGLLGPQPLEEDSGRPEQSDQDSGSTHGCPSSWIAVRPRREAGTDRV